MRVLVLNFEYPPIGGGASPVCGRICEELVKRYHQVTVLTMGFGDLAQHEVLNGVEIHRIDVRRREPNMSYPLEHLRFLRKGRKFMKSFMRGRTFDVIHCHFIISTGILAGWVSKKYRIPFVMTAHGSDLPGYNPDRFSMIHWVTPIWIRSLLKACSSITAPSHFLSSLISPHMPQGRSVEFIPNGIDYPGQNKEKANIILSTGRLLPRKGFQDLIKAVSDEDLGYEVHICGDGPEMDTLETLASTSKTKVILHGWLDNKSDRYINLLSSAKIYCLVSKFENASIAILEAMANACAIITSDESGTAEMVAEAGIKLPFNDVQALSSKLKMLVKNDDIRKKYGTEASKRAISTYMWKDIISSYEMTLRKAIDNN